MAGYRCVADGPQAVHKPFLARETEIFVSGRLARGCKLIMEGLVDGDAHMDDTVCRMLFIMPEAHVSESGSISGACSDTDGMFAVQPPSAGIAERFRE